MVEISDIIATFAGGILAYWLLSGFIWGGSIIYATTFSLAFLLFFSGLISVFVSEFFQIIGMPFVDTFLGTFLTNFGIFGAFLAPIMPAGFIFTALVVGVVAGALATAVKFGLGYFGM